MSATRLLPAVLSACLAATAAHAASIGLDVKTGLWEMVSSGEASGAPPMPSLPAEALAHLTPAQSAQIRGAMAAGMKQAGKRRVTKQCVTADTLRRGIKLDEGKNTKRLQRDAGLQHRLGHGDAPAMRRRDARHRHLPLRGGWQLSKCAAP